MGSGEWGVGSGECGVWSVECGVWSAECGVRNAECGIARRFEFEAEVEMEKTNRNETGVEATIPQSAIVNPQSNAPQSAIGIYFAVPTNMERNHENSQGF